MRSLLSRHKLSCLIYVFTHSTSKLFILLRPFPCSISIQFGTRTSNSVGRAELTIKMFNSVEWPSIKFRMFLRVLDRIRFCRSLPLTYVSTRIMLERALVCPLLSFCRQFVVPAHLLHILRRRLSWDVTCCDSLAKVVVFLDFHSFLLSGNSVPY